jgi:hypothetical protein
MNKILNFDASLFEDKYLRLRLSTRYAKHFMSFAQTWWYST